MNEGDEYYDSSDEEDIICSSKYISSDEDDDFLPILAKHRKTSDKAGKPPGKAVSIQDDFENEMASELTMTVQHLAASFSKKSPQPASSLPKKEETTGGKNDQEDAEFYDCVYFDSDESDNEADETNPLKKRKKRKESHRVMTNDELFYDPTLDDQDQEWVNRQRRSYQVKQGRGVKGSTAAGKGKPGSLPPLPRSDAVLNCPACLTTLCMDCQRHEIYHNQYRAMFVFNCAVDMMERLKFPSKSQKKKEYFKKKKMKGNMKSSEDSKQKEELEINESNQNSTDPSKQNEVKTDSPSTTEPTTSSTMGCEGDELYHPVTCKICNTKVGVYDNDEVYHFFNVVTSY